MFGSMASENLARHIVEQLHKAATGKHLDSWEGNLETKTMKTLLDDFANSILKQRDVDEINKYIDMAGIDVAHVYWSNDTFWIASEAVGTEAKEVYEWLKPFADSARADRNR